MSLVDLVMPKMGESIMEATILKWHKQPGDTVKQDETVLEIATDKVDTEVPSNSDGVLTEILYQVNDVVPIGAVIARIRTGAEAASSTPVETAPAERANPPAPAHDPAYSHVANGNNGQAHSANRFYSPLVLNIAASEGVPLHELEAIPGSGNEGRVTKKDILQYVSDKKAGIHSYTAPQPAVQQPAAASTHRQETAPAYTAAGPAQYQAPASGSRFGAQPGSSSGLPSGASYVPAQQAPATVASAPSYSEPSRDIPAPPVHPTTLPSGNVEIIEMDRMRRLIADHMVRSKHTSPHVTSFAEADVTNMVHWREKAKKEFEKREGTKLTFTPLFIEAIVRCIKKYPFVNSSVEGDKIILRKDINIGMATALPSGNLIVPVIRNADQLNLVGLARQVNNLADNARQGKLRPDDTQGGTFTMTNVGTFGSLMGTPIINQPQVAILAVGAIKKRPVVLETPEGDAIVIRHMMYLSLSYDHRIVDGSLGATFLSAIAKELESFTTDRTF